MSSKGVSPPLPMALSELEEESLTLDDLVGPPTASPRSPRHAALAAARKRKAYLEDAANEASLREHGAVKRRAAPEEDKPAQ